MAMQHVMSDLDVSGLYQVPDVVRTVNSTLTTSSFSYDPARAILGFLLRLLPLVTVWRVVVLVLVLGNLKNIPLIWHLRIVNAFRFTLRTQRPKAPITPAHLFQPLITTTHAPLMEIDFNLHKNNSSYFSDIDIARTHLICTLFSTGIEHMRGGTGTITGSRRPVLGLPVGGVSCTFKKELKPYEPYELWTRVLSWDEKWIYIVTHFVRAGVMKPANYTLYPQQNTETKTSNPESLIDIAEENDAVVATALSRCVFKQGRRTIAPAVMLQLSGLIPAEPPEAKPAPKGSPPLKPLSSRSRRRRSRAPTSPTPSTDSGIDMEMDDSEESELERIERERCRGIKVAATLTPPAQHVLEREFTAGGEALGRHRDGTGLTGVVSTLAQLARLKRDQIL